METAPKRFFIEPFEGVDEEVKGDERDDPTVFIILVDRPIVHEPVNQRTLHVRKRGVPGVDVCHKEQGEGNAQPSHAGEAARCPVVVGYWRCHTKK